MPKWISKKVPGKGRMWVPVNDAAKEVAVKKGVQDGEAKPEELAVVKSQVVAKTIKAEVEERDRIAKDTAERTKVHGLLHKSMEKKDVDADKARGKVE